MREPNQVLVITWVAVVLAGSVAAFAQNSLDDVNQPVPNRFGLVVNPEAGFVVKTGLSTDGETLNGGWLQRRQPNLFAGEAISAVGVGGEGHSNLALFETPDSNGLAVAALEADPAVDYVAPLFSLDGEIVAVIPEIIVRLRQATDRERLENLCRETGCAIVRNLLYTDLEFLIAPPARNAEEVLATAELLDESDFVEWAYPNLGLRPQPWGLVGTNELDRVEPNDTYVDRQWHLNAIRAPEAWAFLARDPNLVKDPNVVVAVLDCGIDMAHPDLAESIWVNPNEIPGNGIDDDGNGKIDDIHGWDFFGNDDDASPDDPTDPNNAHGTACAGLIAARGNNLLGVVGVAPRCTIMPVRISGSGMFIPNDTIATAIRYAAISGAAVLNNSWCGAGTTHLQYVIREVTQDHRIGRNGKGCVLLFASGNSGGSLRYPGKYGEVIAVGAIGQNEAVWHYSCGGPQLDVVAPSGCAITGLCDPVYGLWTTDISGHSGLSADPCGTLDYTDKVDGTSGACPIAAGIAALVLSVDPNLTAAEVRSILSHSSRDLAPAGWDARSGFGCVDAYAAVTMALNPSCGSILFVDDDAPNDPGPSNSNLSDLLEDGSQQHPFDTIQEAIDRSVHGDTVVVLSGTYTGKGNTVMSLRGRAITVRSLEGPEKCKIDCQCTCQAFRFEDGESSNSVLDDFTIANGRSDYGGAIRIGSGSSPTLFNCVFSNSVSTVCGGAIFVSDASATWMQARNCPVISGCAFNGNRADCGGAVYVDKDAFPDVNDCTFARNEATYGGGLYARGLLSIYKCCFTENTATDGGGVYMSNAYRIRSCTFTANNAESYGGGAFFKGDPSVTDCTFERNSASCGAGFFSDSMTLRNCAFFENSAIAGGGTYLRGYETIVERCTFVKNTAVNMGGGIVVWPQIVGWSGQKPTVSDCILWANGPDQVAIRGSPVSISYSDIQGGLEGDGNIDVDPLFVDPDNGDFHLKSQAGRWDPISATWVTDDVTSPGIDAGDPSSPVGEESEPNGGRINMGAYGGTAQASKSP